MKKYDVRIYLHTFIDVEVEAENESDAIDVANEKEWNMGEILGNMCEEKEPDIEALEYSVFVGGGEVNDYLLTKEEAEEMARNYINEGYDDVKVVNVNEKQP